MYKRNKMMKLQYLRPQTEVIAATYPHMMAASVYGHAGNGDLEVTGDAKKSNLGYEFSFNDVWEKEL